MDLNRDNEDVEDRRWESGRRKTNLNWFVSGRLRATKRETFVRYENSRRWTRLSSYNVTPRGIDANVNRTLSRCLRSKLLASAMLSNAISYYVCWSVSHRAPVGVEE